MSVDETAASPQKTAGQAFGRAGIAWMIATTVFFVSQDATMRVLTRSYPVLEVAWARFTVHMLLVAGMVAWHNPHLMRSSRPVLQMVRSLLLLAAMLFSTLSLRSLPFAEVQAVAAAAPVLVTALSVPLLREKVGWRRWAGVLGGLSGTLLIIGPASGTFHWVVALPLAAALANALYQICTRMLKGDDKPGTTMFYTSLAGALITTLLLPFNWVTPDVTGAALMLLLGVLGLISHFCLIRAYTAASAATVAPFGYMTLVWAAFFSLTIFGETLTPFTLGGGAIIVLSGVYIFHREQTRDH